MVFRFDAAKYFPLSLDDLVDKVYFLVSLKFAFVVRNNNNNYAMRESYNFADALQYGMGFKMYT